MPELKENSSPYLGRAEGRLIKKTLRGKQKAFCWVGEISGVVHTSKSRNGGLERPSRRRRQESLPSTTRERNARHRLLEGGE